MMTTKQILILAILCYLINQPTVVMSQELKQFTLEDLNYGVTNYRNMVPGNQYYTWWGDQLVRIDVEECYLVDMKTGRETMLLDTALINNIISADNHLRVRHLYNVQFPEAGKHHVMVNNGRENILVDWKTRSVIWREKTLENAQPLEFCPTSKANAVLKG